MASLIVVDGSRASATALCFPPVPCARRCRRNLSALDALIVVGDGAAAAPVAPPSLRRAGPVLSAISGPTMRRWRRCAANACWLSPDRRSPSGSSGACAPAGSKIVRERAFADHHPYAPSEI